MKGAVKSGLQHLLFVQYLWTAESLSITAMLRVSLPTEMRSRGMTIIACRAGLAAANFQQNLSQAGDEETGKDSDPDEP